MSCCAGLPPMTGTRPSRNENTWISTMPSQNTGTDTNSDGMDSSAPLIHEVLL